MVRTNGKRIRIMLLLIAVLLCVLGTSEILEYREYLRTHEAYQDVTFEVGDLVASRIKILELEGDAEEQTLRLYLPIQSNGQNITIHMSQLGSISIDGQEYRAGDKLNATHPDLNHYIMFKSPEGAIISRAKLEILSSSQVATLFINLQNYSLQEIHESEKTLRDESGYMLLDSFGSIDSMGVVGFSGRGTFSWYETDKKSYNFHLKEPKQLLGMGECTKWALRSTPTDSTMMMDQLAYRLARRLELPYAIDSNYVNLYIDGEYRGLYLLVQKASSIDGSLQIEDLSTENEWQNKKNVLRYDSRNKMKYYDVLEPEDISGGYLLEFNDKSRYDRNDPGFETQEKYVTIHAPYNIGPNEIEYIADLVRNAENVIYSADDKTKLTAIEKYMDLDTWCATYWMDEFLCDYDADYTSFFFYKKAGDSLLYAGPVWDYDEAYWHTFYNDDYQAQMLTTASQQAPSWMQQLESIPAFRDCIQKYYLDTFSTSVHTMDENDVTVLARELEDARIMNNDRWNLPNERAYSIDVENMYHAWLNARMAFYDDYCKNESNYVRMTFVYPTDSNIRHNVVLAFRKGDRIDGWPGKESEQFWFDEQGNKPYESMNVDRDYTFYLAN